MAHVPTPPITPRTGLWGLGFRMDVIATHFYNLYQDIEGAWVVGKWLAYPFYVLSLYFGIARDKCWEADQDLVKALTWVKGLTEGSVIADILERIWYEFTFLRYDPIGWVRQKIDQVSGELSFLRNDPYGWIRSRLYLALPVFYSLLGNSGWWIYSKLNERYPEIGEFIRDSWNFIHSKVLSLFSWARDLEGNPTNAVIGWINRRSGWFWSFIIDPIGVIRGFIVSISWDMRTLVQEPDRWVRLKLSGILGIPENELYNLPVALVRRMFSVILSNQEGLLDYTKEAIINLILRFI